MDDGGIMPMPHTGGDADARASFPLRLVAAAELSCEQGGKFFFDELSILMGLKSLLCHFLVIALSKSLHISSL